MQKNSLFTNVALSDDMNPWWEGIGYPAPAAGVIDWKGNRWMPGSAREGRAPELAVHRPGPAVSVDLAPLGRSTGRSDLGHPLRRPSRPRRAARLPVIRLEPRRLRRGIGGERDDGGRDRSRGRCSSRPDGDAPLLRVQHGRLLGALGQDRDAQRQDAEDLPRELVPTRRGREVPLARVRGERPRASLDPRPVPGRGRGGRDADRLRPDRDGIDRSGLDVSEATMQALLRVDREEWKGEIAGMREFFAKFESKLPAEMRRQVDGLEKRLGT